MCKLPPDIERLRHSVHRSSRCSRRLVLGTTTRQVSDTLHACEVCPLLSLLRGCILCRRKRCRPCPTRSMPVLLTCCERLSVHQAPVLRGPVVRAAGRRQGLLCGRGAAKLPLLVLRVAVHHTKGSGQLITKFRRVFCANSVLSFIICGGQSRSSPLPATKKSSPCTAMSKSRDACPNEHEHLLES